MLETATGESAIAVVLVAELVMRRESDEDIVSVVDSKAIDDSPVDWIGQPLPDDISSARVRPPPIQAPCTVLHPHGQLQNAPHVILRQCESSGQVPSNLSGISVTD